MKQKTNVTPLQKVESVKEKDDRSVVSSLSPREIVSELDRYGKEGLLLCSRFYSSS